jgi:UDP-4-amino-4,6-dideoxy-N-acetyl-beta-L-altrosamine N-acetyltransferase
MGMNRTIKENIYIEHYNLINFINLTEQESEMVRNWRNNESVRKWMYNDNEISIGEHRNFINLLKNYNEKAYWLVKIDKEYVAVLDLLNINWQYRRAYFGIYANPESRTAGIGRILDNLADKIAFEILNLHSLKLEVLETNERVINLHKKMGFTIEGKLKDYVFKDGKWLDVLTMGKINPKEENKDGNPNTK